MSKSRHMQARMSQRAISQKLVELTLEFGVERHDGKVVLSRKGLQILVRELKALEQTAQRALGKGGLIVVCDGDTLITTYSLNSYRRKGAQSRTCGSCDADERLASTVEFRPEVDTQERL